MVLGYLEKYPSVPHQNACFTCRPESQARIWTKSNKVQRRVANLHGKTYGKYISQFQNVAATWRCRLRNTSRHVIVIGNCMPNNLVKSKIWSQLTQHPFIQPHAVGLNGPAETFSKIVENNQLAMLRLCNNAYKNVEHKILYKIGHFSYMK